MPIPLKLPSHKTKIVCTIGPSSCSAARLEALIKSGMNVARLNFSHGEFKEHASNIRNIRKLAAQTRHRVSILIDLPGVKIRVGQFQNGSVTLKKNQETVLTTRQVPGTEALIPVEFKLFSRSVSKGGVIFLNDGFIQLKVERVAGPDVFCRVLIGGKLLSHKGLNLPGAKLNIDPVTDRDLQMVDFGLRQGVHIFGLSFVESPRDIIKVREFARKKGHSVYLVAKIERREAIENFDEILKEADAVMIARGDMGVEIPIEEVPGIQKALIQKANTAGCPVITATQMLESMTHNVRPTRAEVNDVANAILDGTDAVMLSEETAIGDYPVETVRMMARIAVTTEHQRDSGALSNHEGRQTGDRVAQSGALTINDVTSLNAVRAARQLDARYILTPTNNGDTARRISRFKPSCWVLSFCAHVQVSLFLNLSYGVHPFSLNKKTTHDPHALFKDLKKYRLAKRGDTVILTESRLSCGQGVTDSLGVVTL